LTQGDPVDIKDPMTSCRECKQQISDQAFHCPHCGAPYPARPKWDGWGFEYRSTTNILGWPLLHISFKYRPNRVPVPARGILAIGQFGIGVFTLAQFGVGVFGIGQFMAGGFILAQFALALRLVAQIGLYLQTGKGQLIWWVGDLIGR
jgi:hypothetical protein